MAIVKKISELTPKGSALANTDLLVVGVDNGTDYDLKSVTGAQILGNVISQTIADGDTTHSPSSNVVFDSLALKVDKVTGKGLSTEDYTTAEKSKLAGLSGTNTGDQTLQQVTDKGSTTTNPISITTTGANSYLAGNTIISQNNFGRYTTIDSDGKVTINSNGVNTSQLRASNITADVILEFPNKTVGTYTIATTTDLTSKVDGNTAITGATKTKITYDSKGLVTSGADATTADIADSTNKRYVTDANLTTIGNTSGTNTGDQVISDATITTTDITTNNFTTSKHGFVPKGTNVGKFLKDDGTWGTPASGSSGGIVGIANSSGVYTYYTTLSLAMTAAVSGQTIELFSDITETGSVTITLKNGVNINGNGHTYTLSVNDGTNAFTGANLQMEFYNLKVIRTGRANGNGGYVLLSSNVSLTIIKCYGTTFINTFGECCVLNNCSLYGINAIGYYNAITDYGASKIYNAICESNGLGYGISTSFGSVYNSTGISVTTSGILCNGEVYESIGISTSGIGIEGQKITNSTGISTSGTALSSAEARNCVGISTSGIAGNGTFYNSTLISSSNYAITGGGAGGKIYNSYAQSTSSPTSLATNMYSSTVRCLWNNAGGNCTTSFGVSSFEILNSFLEVTNASAYCITGYIGSTWKYSNNSFKGATTAVNSTNITQGITNTSDTKGNILI